MNGYKKFVELVVWYEGTMCMQNFSQLFNILAL